jgi:hypothetical protein
MSARDEWGPGPWDGEPDHVDWYDEATGMVCMINRGPLGALCGYVGVEPEHPLHGAEASDKRLDHVECHGDINYASACEEGGEICHVPAEGRSHDVWWFGFDCGHGYDVVPEFANNPRLRDIANRYGVYRDIAYVTKVVTKMAADLAAVTS